MPSVIVDPAIARSVIAADALTKMFGAFAATDRVTFEVPQGEIFGLLGPNGAGKSTTFKMLCGLLVPTAGHASVMGIDLRRHAARARQRLGYMAQKFSLYGDLSVGQNLNFFAGVYGLDGARRAAKIREMVDTFALGPYVDATPDTLSLGFAKFLIAGVHGSRQIRQDLWHPSERPTATSGAAMGVVVRPFARNWPTTLRLSGT